MLEATKALMFLAAAYLPGASAFDGHRPRALDLPLQRLHDTLHAALVNGSEIAWGVVSDPRSHLLLRPLCEAIDAAL